MKFIFIFCTSCLSYVSLLFAKPELYDHLDFYKKRNVPYKGPSEEVVVSTEEDFIPSSAKYEYNDKNQLSTIIFYAKDVITGKVSYVYNEIGLTDEILFNPEGGILEHIFYHLDNNGNILGYKIEGSELHWEFQYKNGFLVSGQRLIGSTINESFVYKPFNPKLQNLLLTQDLLDERKNKIGVIDYIYKNNLLVKKVRKDRFKNIKLVEYYYTPNGVISEMRFYLNEGGGSQLVKTHRFK